MQNAQAIPYKMVLVFREQGKILVTRKDKEGPWSLPIQDIERSTNNTGAKFVEQMGQHIYPLNDEPSERYVFFRWSGQPSSEFLPGERRYIDIKATADRKILDPLSRELVRRLSVLTLKHPVPKQPARRSF